MNIKKETPEEISMDVDTIRAAAMKMHGAERRAFLAEVTLKYCQGNARKAETVFGWGRSTIETGLSEKRTGIICLGAQSCFSGRKRWEDKFPEAAEALRQLAESHAQQDPSFRSNLAYTRLTAKEALTQLQLLGFTDEQLPSPGIMAEILNRMGYRLRKVVKAKPQKKFQKLTQSLPTSRKKTARTKQAGLNV